MALPDGIVNDFERITNYPLGNFLNDFTTFVDSGRSDILDYYGGVVSKPNESAFSELGRLLSESESIMEVSQQHASQLSNAAYWELIVIMTDIQSSLQTIDNSSKWLRSAIAKNDFSPDVELEHILKQNQTLEDIAVSVGSTDKESDWVRIALRNDLTEDMYTVDGGNQIVAGNINRMTIKLDSVVDNIVGKKVYGVDLDKTIQFADDDLVALSNEDTIKQTVEVLAGLRQGQTPEFPEDGIQSSIVSGSNRNQIAYPILMRQYYNTFRKDDTLKSLTITNIQLLTDSLVVEFSIETRLSEVVETNVSI